MIAAFSTDFLFSLIINSIANYVLVRFCYFHFSPNRAYAASFLLFGLGVFLVTKLLHATDLSMGFAFGLFAIFSMLRYRTESISIKEMTYLFLVISISLLCAVSSMSPVELAALCALICAMAWLMETNLLLPLLKEQVIDYEKIDNIKPDRRPQLMQDLRDRTGLNIKRLEIVSIDFLRDTAKIRISYRD